MNNPWLSIPLGDYEGHMSLPAIGQAAMLADQLERAIAKYSPQSIAVIGCSGGNGLERIVGGTVKRIVALDLNRDYLEQVRARHAQRIEELELLCGDVQSESLRFAPVDLIYAALLFEYVNVPSALRTLKRNSGPNTWLTTVLQLPNATLQTISPSPYQALDRLAPIIKLVPPETLRCEAVDAGFTSVNSSTIELPSGKQFCLQTFRA